MNGGVQQFLRKGWGPGLHQDIFLRPMISYQEFPFIRFARFLSSSCSLHFECHE